MVASLEPLRGLDDDGLLAELGQGILS